MGTDASATLFYGFLLPELVVDCYDLNEEWAKKHRPPQPQDKANYKTAEWDEWRRLLKAYEATPQHVEIAWSGSEYDKQYYIHCPCYEKRVYWAKVKEILVVDLEEADVVEAKRWLHEFCDCFNLPRREPGWFLAARYF
jgi:hypothetical protein